MPAKTQDYQPQFYDRNARPIYPGDLLRHLHFVGARGKKYWLYHVATLRNGAMEMVPTSALEPTQANHGGRFWASEAVTAKMEIISGYGPDFGENFDDRPKRDQHANQNKNKAKVPRANRARS